MNYENIQRGIEAYKAWAASGYDARKLGAWQAWKASATADEIEEVEWQVGY